MKETIRNYIVQKVGDQVTFTDEDDIFALGFVNSLFALQLVTYLEKEFAIMVENEDLDLNNFRSVNNLHQFVTQKQANKQ